MLVNGRHQMVARAYRAYCAQTYANKSLMIWDTGDPYYPLPTQVVDVKMWRSRPGPTIGELRNSAIRSSSADIIAHWDSDDWSHPLRMEEQVALLDSDDIDVVGYNSMLFWDTRSDGRAWRYVNPNPRYALGTSLMYWREVWRTQPFESVNHGEDERFIRKLNCRGIGRSARMIASIHGGNTGPYAPESEPTMWHRVLHWDSYCKERMQL